MEDIMGIPSAAEASSSKVLASLTIAFSKRRVLSLVSNIEMVSVPRT